MATVQIIKATQAAVEKANQAIDFTEPTDVLIMKTVAMVNSALVESISGNYDNIMVAITLAEVEKSVLMVRDEIVHRIQTEAENQGATVNPHIDAAPAEYFPEEHDAK